MHWTDGHGREWSVEAGPEVIVLRLDGDVLRFERAEWRERVQLAVSGTNTLLRFYGTDTDVGFLLSEDQSREFFALTETAVAAVAAVEGPTQTAAATRRELMWPKMTASAVWSLICGALAFLPVAGLLFGLATIVLTVVARRGTRQAAAFNHVRAMCRAALILAWVGMAVSLLAVYSYAHVGRDAGGLLDRLEPLDVAYSYGTIGAIILVVVLSLSVHECGHALSAWWCGDDLARSRGRVTLNPFAHIDPFGTVILPLILAVANGPVFGYAKPVPVRLAGIRRYRRAHILISLAGPGANLLLAAISMGLFLALGCVLACFVPEARVTGYSSWTPVVVIEGITGGQVLSAVAMVLKAAVMANVFLAFFNLIPIPPLDGSWVLEHLFPNTLGRLYAAVRPYGFIIFLAFYWTDLFGMLLFPAVILWGGGMAVVGVCTGL